MTMVDIARRAGISVATVSRVLHQALDVTPTARTTIQALIDLLHYVPQASARPLVTRHT